MMQTTQITLRDRIQTIEDAISSGQIEQATNDCQRILSRYPDALEIQRLLGEVYLAQDRLDEAQQIFDWILVNDPENVIVYCDRALICEHHSDIDTALDCYQQAYELSRGNSQIRQEFNNLSARIGQQEFMLSRAGLARLYMRGHLFTQAIQEWEAVLTASPDRLDARLGLLETCWREGLYDEVERMATRILEEVPQCLKALLLMAHIASAYNMQRARDLIDRAVMLDPELLMAQDLFSELSLSQPNDPFLTLIKKAPIDLNSSEMNGNGKSIDVINTLEYATVDVATESSDDTVERVYNWNDIDNWSELDTRDVPLTASARHAGSEADEAEQTRTASAKDEPIDDFDTWVSQQEIDDDFDPALLEKQPWFQAEQAIATSVHGSSNLSDAPTIKPSHTIDQALPHDAPSPATQTAAAQPDPVNDPWNTFSPQLESWSSYAPKEETSVPPAWLDMLTGFEQRQPTGEIPARPQTSMAPDPIAPTSPPLPVSESDDDDDMGWPEWLKSLGAESIEPESSTYGAEPQQLASTGSWGDTFRSSSNPAQAPELTQYPIWVDEPQTQPNAIPNTDVAASWTEQLEQSAQTALPEKEASIITTLEFLEQNLRSQGFVPLQPGSLSAIAQETTQLTQSTSPLTENETHETDARPVEQAEIPVQPASQSETEQHFEQIEAPAPQSVQPAVEQAPVYSLDTLLDSELETTMRRPAVRLQPMQAEPFQDDRSYAPVARSLDYSAKSADSKLTNKERLVRGYQFQLAGSYDDAMQEYRTLIRTSPESLGEVISDLRALLKLAPKYTAGYRVLGDAYMRQGEYLQAMEAYNKALTIAKKAKSQSR